MITSLLIANRGEIACRVIRTARRMGIRTVAVHSDADADALHVRQADEAVHIGASPARESYLLGDRIIAAARATGAEAIHPGYGFLSENAEFAQAVLDAGLIWVGPRPSSITAMGLKDAAKALMSDAGVPVTPGYMGDDQSAERLRAEADAIGYPVLIKAVAGGGGKGMRKVDAAADFADALASCRREAASSFGDDRVLLEKWITNPRHIEVQVFGDSHGNVVHLFERDCSLQRRHQKVIEEAPAPGMDETTRAAICDAAVRAARAVDYVGAGTIEFIADGSEGLRADRIWFMEMNTRLQVEHPVTEEITGVDLVEWQLRVAAGEALPRRQDELAIDGWAMEARLYAEDPARGFLPSIGRLDSFDLTADRVETGVYRGASVSPFYDPMIAKLVTHGATRDEARERLERACRAVAIHPVKTNAWFLARLLALGSFRDGEVTTGTIAERADELMAAPEPSAALLQKAADVAVFAAVFTDAQPFRKGLLGFRLNASAAREVRLDVGGEVRSIVHDPDRDLSGTGTIPIERTGSETLLFENGASFPIRPARVEASHTAAADGAILAPMPGRVIAVDVVAGQSVTKGQKLLTLEAMKMEHSLVAPFDGTVAELTVDTGAQVQVEALLVRVEKQD